MNCIYNFNEYFKNCIFFDYFKNNNNENKTTDNKNKTTENDSKKDIWFLINNDNDKNKQKNEFNNDRYSWYIE